MTVISRVNDAGILRTLGSRVRQERLNQNKTQVQLSQSAGVSRIVINRLENGRGCTLGNFIRVLRALGKLDQVGLLLPEPGISPLELARMGGKIRQEASGSRGRKPAKPKGS